MAPRKNPAAEISAESLRLDVPPAEGILLGGFLSADGSESTLEPTVVISDEVHGSPVETPASDHVDIGLWKATFWRDRPIWRHSRTGQTLHKRDKVRKLRNFK